MSKYAIINVEAIQQRIEELENTDDYFSQGSFGEHKFLKQVLSQSTPLIPEIEKAFDEGLQSDMNYFIRLPSHEKLKQDYISNLKLDI